MEFIFFIALVMVSAAVGGAFLNTKKRAEVKNAGQPETEIAEEPYYEYPEIRRAIEDEREIKALMENHDLDMDEAEHVKELMDDEGLSEEEAVELKDEL